MGYQLSGWLRHISNSWVAFSALIVFLLFTALVLPGQASRGGGASPDLSFYYTAGDLYRMAESYGAAGRQDYIRVRFTFDLIWPLVYLVFLVTATIWTYSRVFASDSPWQRANLIPLLAALFDYLENLSTSLVMARYPAPTPLVDGLAGMFTLVKWVFVGGSFVLLLIGVAVGVWRRLATN